MTTGGLGEEPQAQEIYGGLGANPFAAGQF